MRRVTCVVNVKVTLDVDEGVDIDEFLAGSVVVENNDDRVTVVDSQVDGSEIVDSR